MSYPFITNLHHDASPFVWPLEDRQAVTLADLKNDPAVRGLGELVLGP